MGNMLIPFVRVYVDSRSAEEVAGNYGFTCLFACLLSYTQLVMKAAGLWRRVYRLWVDMLVVG